MSYSGDIGEYRVGVITASDTCFQNRATDASGDKLVAVINNGIQGSAARVFAKVILPDDVAQIKAKLLEWCDVERLDLIITTGGTGFSPRDVTPEATKAVIEKEAPGLVLSMLMGSLKVTPLGMLSRPACGIRGKTLIINLPGSTKGSQECLSFVLPALPHALQLLRDEAASIARTHAALQQQHPAAQLGRVAEAATHHCHHHYHPHHCSHSDEPAQGRPVHNDNAVARRHRHSPYPLISVEKALQIVLDETEVTSNTETVAYNDALGRILATDVFAAEPLPPFRASIKDGYAVIASDGAGVRTVIEPCSTAGSELPSATLLPGTCMRINTGGPLPPGSDAVVQVEDTELVAASADGCTELQVKILTSPSIGLDIRPIGCDIAAGELVLARDCRLCAPEVGVLAAVGAVRVTCYSQPVVGIMSTGNEIVEPGGRIAEGKIRDSNRITLMSALRESGFTNIQDLGIVQDSMESLSTALLKALQHCDVVVTTGGGSMGDMDFIKPVLEKVLGATIHFARVLMKPGKPTTFATVLANGRKKLVFALPGNPVSALVTCHLYVLPSLRKMCGAKSIRAPVLKVKVDETLLLDPRPEYRRAYVRWTDAAGSSGPAAPVASVVRGSQESSRLPSLCAADALLVLPARTDEVPAVAAGQLVDAMFIRGLIPM